MIYCLIVDDEPLKVDAIRSVIDQECGPSEVVVEVAGNANEAAMMMRTRGYDLLVMDLNLPVREGAKPSEDGGNKLLRQIGRGAGNLKRPSFLVGVTAFESLAERNLSEFHSQGWALVKFEASSTQWEQTVATQCRHVLEVQSRYRNHRGSEFDACICTALADPELKAFSDHFGAKPHSVAGDAARYSVIDLDANGRSRRIVLAAAPEMGVAGMAVLTTKLLEKFRPKVAMLTGICAGIRADIGDIVIAESALNYESGKWSQDDDGGEAVFASEPRYQQASVGIIDALKQYRSDKERDILGLPARFFGGESPKQPNVCLGPVACGAAVIESSDIIDGLSFQNRKLEGLEMESYGFYLACRHAHRSLEYVMIKGVCDRGRPPKEDRYQKYSAYLSAAIAIDFLTSELSLDSGLFSE